MPAKRLPVFATLALLDNFVPQGKAGNELAAKRVPIARLEMMEAEFSARVNGRDDSITLLYDQLLPFARKYNCTQDDLDLFAKAILPRYSDHPLFSYASGLFISALVNSSSGISFTLSLSHLTHKLDALCYKNAKQIEVVGDAGVSFCCRMLGGSVSLSGSAGWELGKLMKGGEITVEGNAAREIGHKMENGRINVHGNVLRIDLGHMHGGEIHIDGFAAFSESKRWPLLWDCQATDIYQRGMPLVSKGKIVKEPFSK